MQLIKLLGVFSDYQNTIQFILYIILLGDIYLLVSLSTILYLFFYFKFTEENTRNSKKEGRSRIVSWEHI